MRFTPGDNDGVCFLQARVEEEQGWFSYTVAKYDWYVMPMADEMNQARQHHQVEKPRIPRKTAGVKTWRKTRRGNNGSILFPAKKLTDAL